MTRTAKNELTENVPTIWVSGVQVFDLVCLKITRNIGIKPRIRFRY
jgi:hypothetical protein